MNKEGIIECIKAEKPYLQKKFGVDEIALFGSYARGEENTNSDIDILVHLQQPSYSRLIGLYNYLEQKLNKKVDIIRKGPHVSERFFKRISKELIYV